MKLRFAIFMIVFIACTAVCAQNVLTVKGNFMYTDVSLANKGHLCNVNSLIDTGCSLCIVDSAFAVDSCGVKAGEAKVMYVNDDKTALSSVVIDSVSFCGSVYRDVNCLMADLDGIYQKYAPHFIIGADLLKSGVWKFDMQTKTVVRLADSNSVNGMAIKWKNHEDYPDVAMDYIIFDSKIKGRKTRFTFDTGTKYNKLERGLRPGKTEQIEKETANISTPLSVKTSEMCRNVEFMIGKTEFVLDFICSDYNTGLLNIEFLHGHSFILDYPRRMLIVL